MQDADVVVTGIGLIGPLGCSAGEFKLAWESGASAIKKPLAQLAGTSMENSELAVMPEFDPAERLGGRRMLKYMSEAAVLGCIAASEALQDSEALTRYAPESIGLYAATGLAAANVGDVSSMIEQAIDEKGQFSCRLFGERGLPATNPLISFKILANMPPCLISIIEGIKGPNFIFTPWEGQTSAAILEGWEAVKTGEVDCALVGAADTAAFPSTFVYLRQAGYLKDTDEYPASAAAYLVLERAETALRDGRTIYSRLKHMDLKHSENGIYDPLSERVGRTFAAAPALLLGLACLCKEASVSICGVDKQRLDIDLDQL